MIHETILLTMLHLCIAVNNHYIHVLRYVDSDLATPEIETEDTLEEKGVAAPAAVCLEPLIVVFAKKLLKSLTDCGTLVPFVCIASVARG